MKCFLVCRPFNLSGLVFIRFYSLYSFFIPHYSLCIFFRISYFVFRIWVLCLWGKSFVGTLGNSTIGKYEVDSSGSCLLYIIYLSTCIHTHTYVCTHIHTYSYVLAFVFIFVALLILKQIKPFTISRFL